jgi:serine/threonine-protein kinase RsbW
MSPGARLEHAKRPAITAKTVCRIRAFTLNAGLTGLFTALERFATTHRLPQAVHDDLYIALDEIVSNVIRYGRTPHGRPQITVTMALARHVVEVTVVDNATPFNPLARPASRTDQTLVDRPIGGLGILFVTRLMDEVTYSRRAGRNRLVLSKKIRNAPSPAARRRT